MLQTTQTFLIANAKPIWEMKNALIFAPGRVISPVDFVEFIRNTSITFTNSFSPEEAIK